MRGETSTTKKGPGRYTKLTPAVQLSICASIKAGLGDGDSAIRAGVAPSTLCEWKARGEHGEEPFKAFLEAVTEAEVQFKEHHIQLIARHAKKTWNASAWLLERKFPQEFGQRQRVELVDKLTAWVEAFDKL